MILKLNKSLIRRYTSSKPLRPDLSQATSSYTLGRDIRDQPSSSKNSEKENANFSKIFNNPQQVLNLYDNEKNYQHSFLTVKNVTNTDTTLDERGQRVNSSLTNSSSKRQVLTRTDRFGEDIYLQEDHKSYDNVIFDASVGRYKVHKADIPADIKKAAMIQAEKEYNYAIMVEKQNLLDKKKKSSLSPIDLSAVTKEKISQSSGASGRDTSDREHNALSFLEDTSQESLATQKAEIKTAYDAVLEHLKQKSASTNELGLSSPRSIDLANLKPNERENKRYTHLYYNQQATLHSIELSPEELIAKLADTLVYSDENYMVFNKPYNLISTPEKNHIVTHRKLEEEFVEFGAVRKVSDPDSGRGYSMMKPKVSQSARRSIKDYAEGVKKIIYGPESLPREGVDNHFERMMKSTKPYLPFRLGKTVTGCMIVPAHKGPVSDSLLEMHENMLISKVFLAVVLGRPEKREGVIDIPIKRSRVYQFNSTKRIERVVLDHKHGKSNYVPDESEEREWQKMRATIEDMKLRGDRNWSGYSDGSEGSGEAESPTSSKSFGSQYWGQRAVTYFKMLSYSPETNTTILQVQPLTFVENQIEIHLADGLGCPILGDHKHCSDGMARGGMSRTFNKHWYKLAFTQPLPVPVYQAMRWAHPVCTYHNPLHLHCARIYIPGMAGDRQKIGHSKEGYGGLADRLASAKPGSQTGDFIVNNGSDLLCEAPIPDFWHETLKRLGHPWIENISKYMVPARPPRLLERAIQKGAALGEDPDSNKLTFKLTNQNYYDKNLEGKLSTQILASNSVKYASGSKSKYFKLEQSDRLKLLGSREKGNPVRLKGKQRQLLFEKMLDEKAKQDERDGKKLVRMDGRMAASAGAKVSPQASNVSGKQQRSTHAHVPITNLMRMNLLEEDRFRDDRYERIKKETDRIRPKDMQKSGRFDLPGRPSRGSFDANFDPRDFEKSQRNNSRESTDRLSVNFPERKIGEKRAKVTSFGVFGGGESLDF